MDDKDVVSSLGRIVVGIITAIGVAILLSFASDYKSLASKTYVDERVNLIREDLIYIRDKVDSIYETKGDKDVSNKKRDRNR